jgi:hypothetical protein
MAILDSQGRLFGKVSILDVGAAMLILLVLLGVLLPGTTGFAQIGSTMKPVDFDVILRGNDLQNMKSPNPQAPVQAGEKTSLIIRNQPFGEVTVKFVTQMPRTVVVPQPDGSVKALPDPRPEAGLNADFLVTLTGEARMTPNGPVLGNNKIKAGTRVEIEGIDYNYSDLVVQDVRIGK